VFHDDDDDDGGGVVGVVDDGGGGGDASLVPALQVILRMSERQYHWSYSPPAQGAANIASNHRKLNTLLLHSCVTKPLNEGVSLQSVVFARSLVYVYLELRTTG
jgi:hypothetical protein